MLITWPVQTQKLTNKVEKLQRQICLCFALTLLAACSVDGLNSATTASVDSRASTIKTVAADDKEKSVCEAKGGYYSKILGCFDQ